MFAIYSPASLIVRTEPQSGNKEKNVEQLPGLQGAAAQNTQGEASSQDLY